MPVTGRWATAGMVRGGNPDLCWRVLDAQYWASPRLARRVQPLSENGTKGRLSAACGDQCPFLEARGRIPIVRPFQLFRMRGAAKQGHRNNFRNSFGFPTDPFPTLLASAGNPFAFWYEDDPAGGCVRFPTELESERLMGLPEGWTKYGADGAEISAKDRYKALGNAIALPCAVYIMTGIYEVLKQ